MKKVGCAIDASHVKQPSSLKFNKTEAIRHYTYFPRVQFVEHPYLIILSVRNFFAACANIPGTFFDSQLLQLEINAKFTKRRPRQCSSMSQSSMSVCIQTMTPLLSKLLQGTYASTGAFSKPTSALMGTRWWITLWVRKMHVCPSDHWNVDTPLPKGSNLVKAIK